MNLYGITNLLTRCKPDADGNPTSQLCSGSALMSEPRESNIEAWKMASPVHHVTKHSPPTLTLHGTRDTTVDRDQAKELDATLSKAGAEHQLVLVEGIGHTFDLQSWRHKPLPEDLRPTVIGFFDKHLKPSENN